MIYSGSGSSYYFSEFRIRIQTSWFKQSWRKKHLKFNQKDELTNYLPFSIAYYSHTVHTVQNSQVLNYKWSFFLSVLSFFAESGTKIPDTVPGKSSGSTTLTTTMSVSPIGCYLCRVNHLDPWPRSATPAGWRAAAQPQCTAPGPAITHKHVFQLQ